MGRPLPDYYLNEIQLLCCITAGVTAEYTIKKQIKRNAYIVNDGTTDHEVRLVSKAEMASSKVAGTAVMQVREKSKATFDYSVAFLTPSLMYLFEAGEEDPKEFTYDIVEDSTDTTLITGLFIPAEAQWRIKGIPAEDDVAGG